MGIGLGTFLLGQRQHIRCLCDSYSHCKGTGMDNLSRLPCTDEVSLSMQIIEITYLSLYGVPYTARFFALPYCLSNCHYERNLSDSLVEIPFTVALPGLRSSEL